MKESREVNRLHQQVLTMASMISWFPWDGRTSLGMTRIEVLRAFVDVGGDRLQDAHELSKLCVRSEDSKQFVWLFTSSSWVACLGKSCDPPRRVCMFVYGQQRWLRASASSRRQSSCSSFVQTSWAKKKSWLTICFTSTQLISRHNFTPTYLAPFSTKNWIWGRYRYCQIT